MQYSTVSSTTVDTVSVLLSGAVFQGHHHMHSSRLVAAELIFVAYAVCGTCTYIGCGVVMWAMLRGTVVTTYPYQSTHFFKALLLGLFSLVMLLTTVLN